MAPQHSGRIRALASKRPGSKGILEATSLPGGLEGPFGASLFLPKLGMQRHSSSCGSITPLCEYTLPCPSAMSIHVHVHVHHVPVPCPSPHPAIPSFPFLNGPSPLHCPVYFFDISPTCLPLCFRLLFSSPPSYSPEDTQPQQRHLLLQAVPNTRQTQNHPHSTKHIPTSTTT